ncbi:hypothetical protein [Staphylococcus epidermidis]
MYLSILVIVLKARDLIVRYHSLYTEKIDVSMVAPTFIDIISD